MALQAGNRLGPYEILAAIGAGGMGEVYRARDAKLGRDVALKVLPEAFARDAERMARFQREAKVLASLNHPNIATIHGLEDSGATHALVMELVEGPTLADRIKQGPIPIDEALRIAKQITEALEYAHERGIVHRDLKPANIKVTSDDAVKVLDFGLAKALENDPSSVDISTSPTISRMATQAGILLGTAAYMSPEQAKGKAVDRRADIWAFGCVLYEMLTGQMAFRGESVTDTLAAVIKEEPDWSQLPAATPIRVRVLLQRCLQKDPKQRLRDIGDARISLDEVLSGAPDPSLAGATQISRPLWRRALPSVVAVLVIALVVLGWAYQRALHAPAQTADVVRFQIPLTARPAPGGGAFALSPDGRQLAFAVTDSDGVSRLWIRSLDSLEARPLPGSESPLFAGVIWSPDSRYIAFDAGGKLKKIDVSGGGVETLCDLSAIALGGSWNRDGVIIFGQFAGVIMKVSANGGSASPLTTLDSSRSELQHVAPSFLPDGRHFIYLRSARKAENSGVYTGSLDAKPEEQDSKRLLATDWGPAYVPSSDPGSGQLLFMRDGTLMAQPFDARRLEFSGESVALAQHVETFVDGGLFSASANGVLAYRTGGGGEASQLSWFDRGGKVLGRVGEQGTYLALTLSPDGTRAAVTRLYSPGLTVALWLLDLSRDTNTLFTFGPSNATLGVWSPDSSRIIFGSNRNGVDDLYQKLASGVKGEQLLLKSSENKYPTSWSRDGRFLLYQASDPKTTKYGLWVLPFNGDKQPFPFQRTEFNYYGGQFSPDGRWVAYFSDESGRDEIYVRTFSSSTAAVSDTGDKWLISTAGGIEPRWRGDGKELYYLAPDGKLMAVEIATNPVFRAGQPKALFQAPVSVSTFQHWWDLTPDGKRFLFPAPAEQGGAPFTVVLNWQAGLKK
jgi:serine/threonine protein kinase/Tol biopolymer transport system component